MSFASYEFHRLYTHTLQEKWFHAVFSSSSSSTLLSIFGSISFCWSLLLLSSSSSHFCVFSTLQVWAKECALFAICIDELERTKWSDDIWTVNHWWSVQWRQQQKSLEQLYMQYVPTYNTLSLRHKIVRMCRGFYDQHTCMHAHPHTERIWIGFNAQVQLSKINKNWKLWHFSTVVLI